MAASNESAEVIKVEAVLPNDYPVVRKSILQNSLVTGNSRLGSAYQRLAGFLIGRSEPRDPEVTRQNFLSTWLRAG